MKKIILITLIIVFVLLSGCTNHSETTERNNPINDYTIQIKDSVAVTDEQILKMIDLPIVFSDTSNEIDYDDFQAIAKNDAVIDFVFTADKDSEAFSAYDGKYGLCFYSHNEGYYAFVFRYKNNQLSYVMGYLYLPKYLPKTEDLLKCKTAFDLQNVDSNYNFNTFCYGYMGSYECLSRRGLISKGINSGYTTLHVTTDGVFDVNYQGLSLENEELFQQSAEKTTVIIEEEDNPILNKVYEVIISKNSHL